MKQPIAMKCSKKQFNEILPKIKHLNVPMDEDFEINPYLTNNWGGELQIGNLGQYHYRIKECKVYEEWNEKIFLEACGIETEKTFSITESQIKEIYETSESHFPIWVKDRMKEWFPEAFESEVKLEVGKWYKGNALFDSLIFILEIEKSEKCNIIHYYGFTHESFKGPEYTNTIANNVHEKSLKEATEQEVFEALKNEAVKRGFKEGVYYWLPNKDWKSVCGKTMMLNPQNHQILYFGDHCIFKEGKWAEIIPTITLSEADIN